MKILYDNEIFLIQKYGGASRYFYELIKNMSGFKDVELSVYMGYFINNYGLEKYSERFKRFKGEKIPLIPKTKLLSIKLQSHLFNKFRNKSDCNLFHQTYYGNYKIRHNEKRIISVLDFTHEKFPELFSKLDNTAKKKKNAILTADGIICISESTKRDLLELYKISEDKIKVIYLGNSLSISKNEEKIPAKPYILYVGDRRTYKNFAIVLKLFEKLDTLKKDFELICFGGGKFSKKEMQSIAETRLTGSVKQISGDDNKLANLYKYAEVFIYPSLYEGFGIPIIEAMKFGCPIIASNRSSLPEIGGNAALYFEPDNLDSLIVSVNQILHNKDKKTELVKNGELRVKLFSWEKCAQETYNFYRKII